jgi:hypothetical protein
MNYGEILSKAWQIIWKHKVLWIFGILAGCAGGGGGGGGGNASSSFQNGSQNGGDMFPRLQHTINQIPPAVIVAIVIGVILLILILVVLAIFLGTIGKIGLIRGTLQADQNMDTRLNFGELFSGSMSYFWRVFLLNLLVGLLIFAAVIVLIIIGFGMTIITFGIGLLCLLPLCCLMFPLIWAISVIVEQSSIAIVVENLGVMDGLRKGWRVVKENPAPMLVMFLILQIAIGLIVGLILGIPMFIVMAPLFVGLIAGGQQAMTVGAMISLMCCVVYLPVLIVLSGILRSYIGSAWTLTYLRLYPMPAASAPEALPEPEPVA